MINRPIYFTACAVLGLMLGIGGAEAFPAEQAKANTVLVTSPSEADTSEAESGEPRRKTASDTPDVPVTRGLVTSRSNATEPVTRTTGTPVTVRAQEDPVSEPTPEPQEQVKPPTVRPDPAPTPPRHRPQPPAAQPPPVPKPNDAVAPQPQPETPAESGTEPAAGEQAPDEPVTPEQ